MIPVPIQFTYLLLSLSCTSAMFRSNIVALKNSVLSRYQSSTNKFVNVFVDALNVFCVALLER